MITGEQTVEMSFKELVEALQQTESKVGLASPDNRLGLRPGMTVVIRTVTYHYAGKVESVDEGRVELSQASWIADSGRWSEFLKTGDANEVEMYFGNANVPLGCIVDWSVINVLPSSTK